MSTAPDPKHPNLPGLIFGCPPSKHRRSSMKRLLERYNVKLRGNERKEDILQKLVELENSIGEREKEALMKWFAGDNTYRSLAGLLGDAMKPPITPKNISEPVTKKARLKEPEDDDILFAAVDKCRICMEKLPPSKFPQKRITNTCKHHPEVCNQCLTKHINVQIQTKASDQITCPECSEKVSTAKIKIYASPEVLERNNKRARLMSLQHLPNFTFCLSPTCESGQIHTGPDQPMMTCTACGFKTCFNHKLPWHEDLTCAEFDLFNSSRVRDEAASEAWIAEHTRLCPNPECGMRIQKKTGCDHLTCDYCLFEFCWSCFADFREIKKRGNDGHKEDCRWHTINENGMPGHGRRRETTGKQPKKPKEPKSKKSKESNNSKKPEAGPAPKELDGPEQLEQPKDVKRQARLEPAHDSAISEDGPKPNVPGVAEDVPKSNDLTAPKDAPQSNDRASPEDLQQSNAPAEPLKSVGPNEAAEKMDFKPKASFAVMYSLEPDHPKELKVANESQEPIKPQPVGSSQSYPLKRPWEE